MTKKNPEAGPVNSSVGPIPEGPRKHPDDYGADGSPDARVEGGVVEDLTVTHGKIGGAGYNSLQNPASPTKHIERSRPANDPLTGEKTSPGQIG